MDRASPSELIIMTVKSSKVRYSTIANNQVQRQLSKYLVNLPPISIDALASDDLDPRKTNAVN
jgi:hypothetical protein